MEKQKLENWFLTPSGGRLVGEIYNDVRGRFPDGTEVITSKIVGYKDGVVITKSGSEYVLGFPNRILFIMEGDAWLETERP